MLESFMSENKIVKIPLKLTEDINDHHESLITHFEEYFPEKTSEL